MVQRGHKGEMIIVRLDSIIPFLQSASALVCIFFPLSLLIVFCEVFFARVPGGVLLFLFRILKLRDDGRAKSGVQ
jgi:hypothetical protein